MIAIEEKTYPLVDRPDEANNMLQKENSPELNDDNQNKVRLLGELISLKRERDQQQHLRTRLFTAIGLVISLAIVLIAFEWKTYSHKELKDLGTMKADFDEIVEMELTQQPPPPPPSNKIIQPVFKEVPDEVEIEEIESIVDVEITEDLSIEDVIFEDVEVEEEVVEEIFSIVEKQPEPIGGFKAFYSYVAENLEYPLKARKMGVGGRVYVRFVVEKDGSITNVEVIKGIGHGCDEEAIRVIAGAPKWTPGKQRGNPVRVYAMVPIFFIFKE